MKLWDKGFSIDKEIEKFTVGNDYQLDENLLKYDILASIAHTSMLNKIGILKNDEVQKLKKELINILKLKNEGKFEIKLEDEDVQTAVENYLTKKLGDLGKKVHTARSRNEIIVHTRLYSKEKSLEISNALIDLINTLLDLAKKNEFVPIPGYTHMQKAMPSSVGLWASAFVEAFLDDFEVLVNAYNINDQNPLGSVTGYGINLDLDREYTTKLLGFKKIQKNVLYAQNSRGKIEAIVLSALNNIMLDINKLATDLLLFAMPEFGFFDVQKELTTGSSIMPQKRNIDILELARAKYSVVFSSMIEINSMSQNLISGYNRNLQLSKEPLIKGIGVTLSTIKIMAYFVEKIKVNKENCMKACSSELFATDEVIDLVKQGSSFRDAYKEIANNLGKVKAVDAVGNIKQKKHIGATGNLGLNNYMAEINKFNDWVKKEETNFNSRISNLLK